MAHQDDSVRIESVTEGIAIEPADRLTDIIGMVREHDPARIRILRVPGNRGQPVVDADEAVAETGEKGSLVGNRGGRLVTPPPASSMDVKDDRQRVRRRLRRKIDVEGVQGRIRGGRTEVVADVTLRHILLGGLSSRPAEDQKPERHSEQSGRDPGGRMMPGRPAGSAASRLSEYLPRLHEPENPR